MQSLVKVIACGTLAIIAAVTSARADCLDDIRKAGVIKSGNGIMGDKPSVWQNQDGSYSASNGTCFRKLASASAFPSKSMWSRNGRR